MFFLCPSLQELLQLEDRLGSVNRGAVQTTIERFTFPHKYKKVRCCLFFGFFCFFEGDKVAENGTFARKTGTAKGKARAGEDQVKGKAEKSEVKTISISRLVRLRLQFAELKGRMTHEAVCREECGRNLKEHLAWI